MIAGASLLPALQSEPDITRAYLEGYYDYDTFLLLQDLYREKLTLCGPVRELLNVPGVMESDLDTLESLCEKGAARLSEIPPGVMEKIGIFLCENRAGRQGGAEGKYETRSRPGLGSDHLFRLDYSDPVLIASSCVTGNGGNRGRFWENRLRVRGTGLFNELWLGNFRGRMGNGLLFGGMPSVRSPVDPPESFEQSFLCPGISLPFGAFVGMGNRRLSPFGFAFKGMGVTAYPAAGGGGLTGARKGLSLGVMGFAVDMPVLPGRRRLLPCGGAFASLKSGGRTLRAEAAIMDSGAAVQISAARTSGGTEIGSVFALYSEHYFNPCGRGPSAFSLYSVKVRSADDSMTLAGLRRDEQYLNLYFKLNRPRLIIRSALLFARSGLFMQDRAGLSVSERFLLNWKGSVLCLEQRLYAVRERAIAFSGTFSSRPCRGIGLEWRGRVSLEKPGEKALSSGLFLSFPFWAGSRLEMGGSYFREQGPSDFRESAALSIGEALALGANGEVEISGLFPLCAGSGPPELAQIKMSMRLSL